MINVLTLSKYIITEASKMKPVMSLNRFKLQYILYFIYCGYMTEYNKQLFTDDIKVDVENDRVYIHSVEQEYRKYFNCFLYSFYVIEDIDYSKEIEDFSVVSELVHDMMNQIQNLDSNSSKGILKLIRHQSPYTKAKSYDDNIIRDKDIIDFFTDE